MVPRCGYLLSFVLEGDLGQVTFMLKDASRFLALSLLLGGHRLLVATDCNSNGVEDLEEIATGASPDCNQNGIPDDCDVARPLIFTLTDAVVILRFLFVGGEAPACKEAVDVDNDGTIAITDPISLLSFLFLGGPEPAKPGPTTLPCGPDPDAPGAQGDLGCKSYETCASPRK